MVAAHTATCARCGGILIPDSDRYGLFLQCLPCGVFTEPGVKRVKLPKPKNADAVAEHEAYWISDIMQDTGCEISDSCLNCPLSVCKYEGLHEYWRFKHRSSDDEIVAEYESYNRRSRDVADAVAEKFGVTQRTVYRVLKRVREENHANANCEVTLEYALSDPKRYYHNVVFTVPVYCWLRGEPTSTAIKFGVEPPPYVTIAAAVQGAIIKPSPAYPEHRRFVGHHIHLSHSLAYLPERSMQAFMAALRTAIEDCSGLKVTRTWGIARSCLSWNEDAPMLAWE